jgi:hypothetical protein
MTEGSARLLKENFNLLYMERSDVTPEMTNRSADVNLAVKWGLNHRKRK